jgi:hypothetical protein
VLFALPEALNLLLAIRRSVETTLAHYLLLRHFRQIKYAASSIAIPMEMPIR